MGNMSSWCRIRWCNQGRCARHRNVMRWRMGNITRLRRIQWGYIQGGRTRQRDGG
ncbi:hypothetical protein K438DRAFT_1879444 [Mycena galopus ATCC 62051]|nr:hypothetical protein K438DRAFT_1879444 [Mycena galopus ATCC 62051]